MDNSSSLRIVSYNCSGLKNSTGAIHDICDHHDIVFLQETWLMPYELPMLSCIHPDFTGNGVSAMDPSQGIHIGRPYGGVAILWRKSLEQAHIRTFNDARIIGLEFKESSVCKILWLNVYLPYQCPDNHDSYLHYIGQIKAIIDSANTNTIGIVGDFNADVNSTFEQELLDMCESEQLQFIDYKYLGRLSDNFTYVSNAHNSTSWLDHILGSHSLLQAMDCVNILSKLPNSDHLPLSATFKIALSDPKLINCKSNTCGAKATWTKATQKNLKAYAMTSSTLLGKIRLPLETIHCKDPLCTSSDHRKEIDLMYNSICSALLQASNDTIPTSKGSSKFDVIPGWNELVKEAHQEARNAYIIWRDCGKPKQGPICEMMRRTRLTFKYSLRQCQRQEATTRADVMAQSLKDHNSKSFWKEVKKHNHVNIPLATTIDGITGEPEIANHWRVHFEDLFNSVNTQSNKSYVQNHMEDINLCEAIISTNDVEKAIKSLKCGKACGFDGLTSEHLKFSAPKCNVLLALCLSSMFSHGYLPASFMKTVLVPIVKNKTGDTGDKGNYRPIALVTVISKLVELIIMERIDTLISTSNQQFGFKKSHGTDMCVFSLKQIIEYYNNHSSPVYVCFLDASKAFDRVNHWTLFRRLIDRGIPLYLVRFLLYWYRNQEFCVRWSSELSSAFNVHNGVRQGGILSPLLFNIYTDNLSGDLTSCNVGCNINGNFMNHLFYADDFTLLAPSPKALQTLINICTEYGMDNDILFNSTKTCVMIFKSPRTKVSVPLFYMNDNILQEVSQYKYLGFIVTNDKRDKKDMMRQLRGIYTRGNVLVRNFSQCHIDTKITLFRSYCAGLYCAQLWSQYSKNDYTKLKASYNNSFRYLFGFPKRSSASTILTMNNVPGFDAIYRGAISSFRNRLATSENDIICTLFNLMGPGNHLFDTWNLLLYV
jgi:exonuclease III